MLCVMSAVCLTSTLSPLRGGTLCDYQRLGHISGYGLKEECYGLDGAVTCYGPRNADQMMITFGKEVCVLGR